MITPFILTCRNNEILNSFFLLSFNLTNHWRDNRAIFLSFVRYKEDEFKELLCCLNLPERTNTTSRWKQSTVGWLLKSCRFSYGIHARVWFRLEKNASECGWSYELVVAWTWWQNWKKLPIKTCWQFTVQFNKSTYLRKTTQRIEWRCEHRKWKTCCRF